MIKKPEEYAQYLNKTDPEVVTRWIFRDMLDLVDIAYNEGLGYPWLRNRIDQALNGAIAPVDRKDQRHSTR